MTSHFVSVHAEIYMKKNGYNLNRRRDKRKKASEKGKVVVKLNKH